jgi:hypothetical protein
LKRHYIVVAAVLLASPLTALGLTFTPGHLYSTTEGGITEYNSAGTPLSGLVPFRGEMHGLSFGPDGLLYVVFADTPSNRYSARVEAIDASGAVIRSYAFAGSIWSSPGHGNISFDPGGQKFYVSAGNGIFKFDIGAQSGSLFKDVPTYDLKVLANGDLLVSHGYDLTRYSSTGDLLGAVYNLSDPNNLANGTTQILSSVRGVEYDPATDTTFVTMLGYTNNFYKVLALEGNSNVLKGIETYNYGTDLFVTDDGRLLVTSTTQAPGVFTTALTYQGQLGGPMAVFFTAMPVPEPEAWALMALGGLVMGIRVRWARYRRPRNFMSGGAV